MRQTSALFFIMMVLGSQATTFLNSAQAKQNIISDVENKNSEFYSLIEEGSSYVVDQVLDLLKNLEDAARNDLAELIKAWAIEKAHLEKLLADATAVWKTQVALRKKKQAEQAAIEEAIRVRVQETADNKKQQAENTATIKRLSKQRCESNMLFVDHQIANNDAILLFKLLLKAIDGYKAGSLIELSNINQASHTLADYINNYASKYAADFNTVMAQLDNTLNLAKDSEVINTKLAAAGKRQVDRKVNNFAGNDKYTQVGRVVQRESNDGNHVDNKKAQIKLVKLDQDTVRSLANVKGQLTKILNELLAKEQQERKDGIEAEGEASDAFIATKSQTQDESRRLQRRNEQLARQIAELKVRLALKIADVKRALAQEARLLALRKQAEKNLADATARFLARKAVLEGEIKLFVRLYAYYKERVYNVATKADRERVEDYTTNKNFKKTEYTRTQEQYNPLDKKVNQYATSTAQEKVGGFKGF